VSKSTGEKNMPAGVVGDFLRRYVVMTGITITVLGLLVALLAVFVTEND
jgi:hypothetical protein